MPRIIVVAPVVLALAALLPVVTVPATVLHPDSELEQPDARTDARFGDALAVGDVNGNGAPDLVVSATGNGSGPANGRGEVHVFLDGASTSAITLFSPDGALLFGEALATADVNNDGYDEVIVASKYADVGQQFGAGEAFVFFGPSLTAWQRIIDPLPQAAAAFGVSVAGGDVNGDGYDEVIVGAWDSNFGPYVKAGETFVFFGPALTTVTTLRSPVPQNVGDFGVATAAGDFTGDGIGDVIVGSWLADAPGAPAAGKVFVFPGPELTTAITLEQPGLRHVGISLASADIDGDPSDEIIAGAQGAAVMFDYTGGATYTSQPMALPAGWSGTGLTSVALGDVTGDGYADAAVGQAARPRGGLTAAGGALLLPGPALDRAYIIEPAVPQLGAEFGWKVTLVPPHGLSPGLAHASSPDADAGAVSTSGVVFGTAAHDADLDAWLDADDNCPADANPSQANNDRDFIDMPAPLPYDDVTHPHSDTLGDACDDDDDNDGLADSAEAAGPPCASASGPTSSLLADTDGDRTLDGAECALGSDPVSVSSAPPMMIAPDADGDGLPDALDPNDANADTDGDRLRDGVEFRYYASDVGLVDTDADGCFDGREVASINADRTVNVIDLQQVAISFGYAGAPAYIAQMDANRDGSVNVIDLRFVASVFGPC